MAYVSRTGQVHQGPAFGLRAILNFIMAIVNFFVFFFKTILNPDSTSDYAARSRRGGGGGGGGGGGYGGGGPPRGPRITGLSDLRDASGAAACGAGG